MWELGWQIQKPFNNTICLDTSRHSQMTLLWCVVHATSIVYWKLSQSPPLTCMRWRKDACFLVRNRREIWITPTPTTKTCVPIYAFGFKYNHTFATPSSRLCRSSREVSSISSFFSPPPISSAFFSLRISSFHLRRYQKPPLCKSYFVVKCADSPSRKPTRRSGCKCRDYGSKGEWEGVRVVARDERPRIFCEETSNLKYKTSTL